jgi:rubrerythrin
MTFDHWNQYFQTHSQHFEHLLWTKEKELNASEKSLITQSIQQFQKGENSDGKHLIQLSKKMKNEDYYEAIKGLVREEQNHALALEKFMLNEEIELIKSHWLDHIFKRIIKTPNLSLTIMVFLFAELIAQIFYECLSKSTQSKTLQAICQQILVDEEKHIQFQIDALRNLYHQYNFIGRFIFRNSYTILMIGASILVWFQYKNIFKKGGYSFSSFFSTIIKSYLIALINISSKAVINFRQKINLHAN